MNDRDAEKSGPVRRTWIHYLQDGGYDDHDTLMSMTREERLDYYRLVYQATGQLWLYIPNPHRDADQTDLPEWSAAEWHVYNAVHQSMWAAMDALAALDDMLDTEVEDDNGREVSE